MRLQTDVHVRFPTSSNTNIVPRPLRPRNLGTIERYLILTNKVGIRKHTTARYRSVVCPLIKLYQFQFSFEKKLIFDFFQRDKYYARRGDQIIAPNDWNGIIHLSVKDSKKKKTFHPK